MLNVRELCYTYGGDGPQAVTAVDNVSFSLGSGELVGLAGHTGSGKSTLAQLLCGLLPADRGEVELDGRLISGGKKIKARELAALVGMVFQYPEYQLFEESVQAELLYGPRNLGWGEAKAEKALMRIAEHFHFKPEFLQQNPLSLSGGEKRKVALASVLIMEPRFLILDEPFVGLDSVTKQEFSRLLIDWQRRQKAAVLCISHDMDQLAAVAQRLLVLDHGRLILDAPIKEAFAETELLRSAGLLQPVPRQLLLALEEAGWQLDVSPITVEKAAESVAAALRERGGKHG